MTDPNNQDPQMATVALAAVREAVERCRPLLADPDPELVAAMLDTASATSELTVILLQLSAPPADDDEPGTGEALERAADLAADTRRHLVTGLNLMAGAHAIAVNVLKPR
jgi:hypothetical protein